MMVTKLNMKIEVAVAQVRGYDDNHSDGDAT